jgi:hypothetical protein
MKALTKLRSHTLTQYQHPEQYPTQYQHPEQYQQYEAQAYAPAWSFTAYTSGATAFAGMFVWTFIVVLGENGVNPFVLNAMHIFGTGFTVAGIYGFTRFMATGKGKILFIFMLAFGVLHLGRAYVSTKAAPVCYLKTQAGNYDARRSGLCFKEVQNELFNSALGGVK